VVSASSVVSKVLFSIIDFQIVFCGSQSQN
jgi:hypothetical protein